MKSSLTINPKFLGMALIAAALSLALFQFVSVKPIYAASGCRELAVALGGCAGPSDETCIIDYCAGKAFEDIMDEVRKETREEMKRENKEETEEEISENIIGTCDVCNGNQCTVMVFEIDDDSDSGTTITFTLGGFQFASISPDTVIVVSVLVQSGSTQKMSIACVGSGSADCHGDIDVLSGGSCTDDDYNLFNFESPITFDCTAD